MKMNENFNCISILASSENYNRNFNIKLFLNCFQQKKWIIILRTYFENVKKHNIINFIFTLYSPNQSKLARTKKCKMYSTLWKFPFIVCQSKWKGENCERGNSKAAKNFLNKKIFLISLEMNNYKYILHIRMNVCWVWVRQWSILLSYKCSYEFLYLKNI